MFSSFTAKLGALLLTLTMSLVLTLLGYFYYYTQSNLLGDLKRSIGDVTRTASYVFNEEERERLSRFKQQVFDNLPDTSDGIIRDFDKAILGETKRLLSASQADALQRELDFQYIVQLLRRIQAGSRESQDSLSLLPQSNITNHNASRVAWAYLLVKVDQASNKTLMFLADSNYQADSVSPRGNPVGNLYRADPFFFAPFRGELGIAKDWYTDEFGTVISAAVPIKAENGEVIATLGVDYDVASFQDRINQQRVMGISLLVVTLIFAVVMTSVIVFVVQRPLSRLKAGAEQQLKKDFDYRVSLHQNDEFGLLAKNMNQVSESLQLYTHDMDRLVAKRTTALEQANSQVVELNNKLAAENAALGGEIEDIRQLKRQCMSSHSWLSSDKLFQVEVQSLSGAACGGDFWQCINSDTASGGFLGTVSGYGLEVSVLAMKIQALLGSHESKIALDKVNEYLYQHFQQQSGGGMAHGIQFSFADNEILIKGYGNPPIVFSSTNVRALEQPEISHPCGVNEDWQLSAFDSVTLDNGQSLLLYSDGFIQSLIRLTCFERDSTPSEIIDISGLADMDLAELFERLQAAPWIEDFPMDISAVVISRTENNT